MNNSGYFHIGAELLSCLCTPRSIIKHRLLGKQMLRGENDVRDFKCPKYRPADYQQDNLQLSPSVDGKSWANIDFYLNTILLSFLKIDENHFLSQFFLSLAALDLKYC